ncbi:hypothetical protein O181_129219 [Austropuccinia psidii MF-1]|uniref:Uncharacterized protein n=1 Tax=Austropuccinia psidii MF-1 TaxID=1389203 RepID=A0A9Q3Q8W2_9BASI|nr:hypothetical protein [Austropuccinia psidii MF-1]
MQAEDSRRQNQSTPHQEKEFDSRKWGHNSIMPHLKASKVKVHTPLGLNSSPRASPATLGEAKILMVLDPFNGSRPYMVKIWQWAISGPLGHPGSPANLDPGAPFWSWGPPRTAAYGPRSTDRRP